MAPLSDLTQAQRPELAHVRPVPLVELSMGALTLYWSTRDVVYRWGSQRRHYASYLLDLSGVGEQAEFGVAGNPRVTLTLADEPYLHYAALSRLNEAVPFLRSTVAIYEALPVDDDEVYADLEAGRTLKWKGVVERLYDIDTRQRTFKLDCCSRLHSLRNRIGLSRISTALYPNADKSHVGQWRNLPIGQLEYLPCKCVKTGAVDRLFADMPDTSLSSFAVSGTSRIPWAASGTLQIDSEQFTYTSYNAATKTFSGVQRARNGTKAAKHGKGATVYQVISEFVYEASCLPVKSITVVDVDSVRQATGSECQVYTGRPGSQLTGYGSAAVVRFTVKPKIEKQINPDVKVDQEHGHSTSTGSHGHSFQGAASVVRSGIGESISGKVSNPDYWRDGSSSTSTYMVSDASNPNRAVLFCTLNNSTNLGTITGIKVVVEMSVSVANSGISSDRFTITYGAYTVKRWSGDTGGGSVGKTTFGWYVSPDAGWGGGLSFEAEKGSANGYASAYIYSAHVEISCSPKIANSPADGVYTSKSGETTVSASALAEAIIGREVCVGLEGVFDDPQCTNGLPAGTITGTPGALIRRPDHVLKYVLCGLMGVPTADIGDSFAVAGAWYASTGYVLDCLVHDIETDGQRLIQELAAQCRSICYEWGGKFELKVLPVWDPGDYDFVIEPEDIVSGPTYSYQPLSEAANRIMVLFRKDYRSQKEYGAEVQGPIKPEALDAGFMDYLEGGWGARDLDDTVRLTAVRVSAAAQDYLDWKVQRAKALDRTISLECHWRATLVQPGMVFSYLDPVYGHGAYWVTRYQRNERERTIAIEGRYLPPWSAGESVAHAYADNAVVVQTHVLAAQKAAAHPAADPVHALTILQAQDTAALAVADSAVVVQTHLLAADPCAASAFADNGPLGLAWGLDPADDLQPLESTNVSGWWEDDTPDLMPRNAVAGSDNLWEADGSGDLMPS